MYLAPKKWTIAVVLNKLPQVNSPISGHSERSSTIEYTHQPTSPQQPEKIYNYKQEQAFALWLSKA
jgi:hypothetical protein